MIADVGTRAQRAAEEHLDACWEAYYAAEDIADPAEWPESPAIAPFCGCQTCLVREVLHAAWPVLTRHIVEIAADALADPAGPRSVDELLEQLRRREANGR